MNQEICINALLGLSFITFMIITMMDSKSEKKTKSLEKILNRYQLDTYHKIVKERTTIFMYSFLSSVMFVLFFIKNKWTATLLCFTLTCALYELAPKSTYMVEHLHTPAQINAWKQYSRNMQVKSAFATLCGVLIMPVLCSLKKNK